MRTQMLRALEYTDLESEVLLVFATKALRRSASAAGRARARRSLASELMSRLRGAVKWRLGAARAAMRNLCRASALLWFTSGASNSVTVAADIARCFRNDAFVSRTLMTPDVFGNGGRNIPIEQVSISAF